MVYTAIAEELRRLRIAYTVRKCHLRRSSSNPYIRIAVEQGERSHGNATASLPGYLSLRPSTLKHAGCGVFAQRPFRRDTPILLCTGTFVPVSKQTLEEARYSFEVPNHDRISFQCFDDGETNLVKYINSATKTTHAPNAEIIWHGAVPVVYATKFIKHGDELLLDYNY